MDEPAALATPLSALVDHQAIVDLTIAYCWALDTHEWDDLDDGPTFMFGGRYDDELVRTADGWRIARRRLGPIWTEGNPAVLVT